MRESVIFGQKNGHEFTILGPFWAHNRPSRGHGWLPLLFLWRFGTTNAHFGAKNPILGAFSMGFSEDFP